MWDTLRDLGLRFGFSVQIVEPVIIDGEFVSSSAVRSAIAEGRVAHAATFGRPFALTGEIVRGAGRGSTVLFPTLNLAPAQELLPKVGVYATETWVEGGWIARPRTSASGRHSTAHCWASKATSSIFRGK